MKIRAITNRLLASISRGLFLFVQHVLDTTRTTDSHSLSSSKSLSDDAVPLDTAALSPSKFLSDSLSATDDLDGAASLEDDQEMSFIKVTSEGIGGIADNAVLLAGKSNSDSSFGSDSGSSLKQDYTNDPLYFADDYVGTKATF
jgi:hypothetical protein